MSNREVERRQTPIPVELRSVDKRTIGGYAAVFNKESQNLGGFVERIDQRAFNRDHGRGWPGQGLGVMARYNHDDNNLIGSSGSGTLRLSIDETGLLYEVDVPNSRNDILELVERRDVRSSSFAFIAHEQEWTSSDQGYPLRSVLSAQLIDVAPVNSPAYLDTSVAMRSLAEKFDAEIEDVKRLAAEDNLRKFFVRTDGPHPAKREFGPSALAKLRQLETPVYD